MVGLRWLAKKMCRDAMGLSLEMQPSGQSPSHYIVITTCKCKTHKAMRQASGVRFQSRVAKLCSVLNQSLGASLDAPLKEQSFEKSEQQPSSIETSSKPRSSLDLHLLAMACRSKSGID